MIDLSDYPSFAIFKKPYAQKFGVLLLSNPAAEFSATQDGFIMAPFDDHRHTPLIIPGKPEWLVPEEFSRRGYHLTTVDSAGSAQSESTDNVTFCSWIKTFLSRHQELGLKKVVLSALYSRPLPADHSPIHFFQVLATAYPHAFVSLVKTPSSGLWIGASPELLTKISDRNLKTVALAATKSVDDRSPWSAKDQGEFAYVAEHIASILGEFAGEYTISRAQPETSISGTVKHLKQTFTAKLPKTFDPVAFIARLHPTPAICGTPTEAARHYMYQCETHDREYFLGYMGTQNHSDCEFYVNIRCAKYLGNRLNLYAGVGVTPDSDPIAEWQETRYKLSVLLSKLLPNPD